MPSPRDFLRAEGAERQARGTFTSVPDELTLSPRVPDRIHSRDVDLYGPPGPGQPTVYHKVFSDTSPLLEAVQFQNFNSGRDSELSSDFDN